MSITIYKNTMTIESLYTLWISKYQVMSQYTCSRLNKSGVTFYQQYRVNMLSSSKWFLLNTNAVLWGFLVMFLFNILAKNILQCYICVTSTSLVFTLVLFVRHSVSLVVSFFIWLKQKDHVNTSKSCFVISKDGLSVQSRFTIDRKLSFYYMCV